MVVVKNCSRQAARPAGRKGKASMRASWLRFLPLAVVFALALQSRTGWAKGFVWESLGPAGGDFVGTVTNPSNAYQIIAIATSPSSVYQTDDGGFNWAKVGDVPSGYVLDMCAYSFSRLYAVTYYGCYRSSNGGAAWSYASFPSNSGYAYTCCAHPTDSNKVYAAGYKYDSGTGKYSLAFFQSGNGGQTWSATSFFSFSSFYPYDMAISKTNPLVMYVCGYVYTGTTYRGALLKTADGGTSWSDISSLVSTTDYPFYAVAVDPTNVNRAYVAGNSYFYRSANGGGSWSPSATSVWGYAIGIDPTNTTRIYLGSYDYAYRSTNYGQNWTISAYQAIHGTASQVEVAPSTPANVRIAASYGLYGSADSGGSWAAIHDRLCLTTVSALAIAPSTPSRLFIEHDGCTVYGCENSGASWQDKGNFVICGNVGALSVNPTNPDIILALEGGG